MRKWTRSTDMLWRLWCIVACSFFIFLSQCFRSYLPTPIKNSVYWCKYLCDHESLQDAKISAHVWLNPDDNETSMIKRSSDWAQAAGNNTEVLMWCPVAAVAIVTHWPSSKFIIERAFNTCQNHFWPKALQQINMPVKCRYGFHMFSSMIWIATWLWNTARMGCSRCRPERAWNSRGSRFTCLAEQSSNLRTVYLACSKSWKYIHMCAHPCSEPVQVWKIS